jgi:hypothetical protein
MKRKWIFWLSVAAVLAGIAAAAYSYTGPHRTVTSTYTTDERRICYWEATHPDVPSGQTCFLKLYYAPSGSCPYLNPGTNQGYFSASSCMPAWHGLSCPASGGRLCSISGSDTWTEDCTPGQPGCTAVQHTTTTTYPPATVSGTTACSHTGNNGWCTGVASLALTASEPLAGYSITGIESSLGMLCGGSSCAWSFPEGSTSLSYWALSSYGDTSLQASASMKVDTVPPVLSILPSGGIPGDNGWFISGPVTASASASDDTSGVAGVSFNGGGSSFTASADGVYSLTVLATDNAGNSATGSAEVRIDSTPPSLTVSASPLDGNNGWYLSPAALNAVASDLTSGVGSLQFRLDGGGWQAGSGATVSLEGMHSVQFQARDQAGNVAFSAPIPVQLDFTPPVPDASLSAPDGLNGWYISPVTITADSSDAVSGLALQGVSLDGTSWNPSVTISTDGSYAVQVQAQDNAGNTAGSSQTVHVDTTAPAADFILPPADGEGGWYVSSVTVAAGGSDATSGVASQLVSLDGSSWSENLTLSEDGFYSVQARVTDKAGNLTTLSRTIQIDHTEPILSAPTLTGTSGLSGWYTSSVEFNSSASDATSGLASLLYSLDGGAWQMGPLTLTDGRHTVQVQSTDHAGNISTAVQQVTVDSTPPQSGFTSPAEGSVAFAHGAEFVMSGQSLDGTSGLSEAQISLDGGSTWQPITLDTDGSWSYTWDTTRVPNGSHVVLVEAGDLAGNLEHTARITVIVANLGPSVSITESFWVSQPAEVGFSAGILPITGARLVVSDGGEHSRTFNYPAGSLPSSFKWDGVWEDGTRARPGSYQVEISAWDMFGNDGHATGTVRVPYPVTQTPTPTSTPTSTLTPSPTGTPTRTASPTPLPPPATPGPQAPAAPVVSAPPEPSSRKVMLWPIIGLVALLAALASASLSDPRPRALRRLAKTLESIQGEQS